MTKSYKRKRDGRYVEIMELDENGRFVVDFSTRGLELLGLIFVPENADQLTPLEMRRLALGQIIEENIEWKAKEERGLRAKEIVEDEWPDYFNAYLRRSEKESQTN